MDNLNSIEFSVELVFHMVFHTHPIHQHSPKFTSYSLSNIHCHPSTYINIQYEAKDSHWDSQGFHQGATFQHRLFQHLRQGPFGRDVRDVLSLRRMRKDGLGGQHLT